MKRVKITKDYRCAICNEYAVVPFFNTKKGIVRNPTHGECRNEKCGDD